MFEWGSGDQISEDRNRRLKAFLSGDQKYCKMIRRSKAI
jgi:hypothetical protein